MSNSKQILVKALFENQQSINEIFNDFEIDSDRSLFYRINNLYNRLLGRNVDSEGYQQYKKALINSNELSVLLSLSKSDEFRCKYNLQKTNVIQKKEVAELHSDITFSVVVCTLNRLDRLKKLVSFMNDNKHVDFIVVVGPSDDDTLIYLKSILIPNLKISFCPERNLSMARNIGLEVSSTDIVAFIDDDAIPSESWVNDILFNFTMYPNCSAIGGRVCDFTGYRFQYQFSEADCLGNGYWNFFEPRKVYFENSKIVRYPYLQGTNMAFIRKDLLSIGGFDEKYRYFLDDVDVCFRMINNKFNIRQVHNSIVTHYFADSHYRIKGLLSTYEEVIFSKIYFSVKHGQNSYDDQTILKDIFSFLRSLFGNYVIHCDDDREVNAFIKKFKYDLNSALNRLIYAF